MSSVQTSPLVVAASGYQDKINKYDWIKVISIGSLIIGSIGVIFGIVNLILTLAAIGYQSEYDTMLTELQGIKNDLDKYNMTERFKQGWLNSAMMFQGNFTKEQLEDGHKGLMNAANWLKDKDSDQMEQINDFLEGGIEMVEQMTEALAEEEVEEIMKILPEMLQYNLAQYGAFKGLEQIISSENPAQVEEEMMTTIMTSTLMQSIVSYALLSEMEEMSEEEANQFITTVATQFVSFLTGEGFDVMQEFRDTIDGKEEEAASDAVAQAFQDGLTQMVQAICSISKTECSEQDIQQGIEGLADVLVSMFGGYED